MDEKRHDYKPKLMAGVLVAGQVMGLTGLGVLPILG
jgi:hypothetical protein